MGCGWILYGRSIYRYVCINLMILGWGFVRAWNLALDMNECVHCVDVDVFDHVEMSRFCHSLLSAKLVLQS